MSIGTNMINMKSLVVAFKFQRFSFNFELQFDTTMKKIKIKNNKTILFRKKIYYIN